MLNTESRNTELYDEEKLANRQVHFMPKKHRATRNIHRRPRRHSRPRSTPSEIMQRQPRIEQSNSIELPYIAIELGQGDFREVEWVEANLNGRDARSADFSAAILIDLCALGANFADTQLEEAQLENASFCGATLTNANLRHANLRNANLTWSDLRGVTLFAANLRGANLCWADLRDADLRQANFVGAYYNDETQWPIDFAPSLAHLIHLTGSR